MLLLLSVSCPDSKYIMCTLLNCVLMVFSGSDSLFFNGYYGYGSGITLKWEKTQNHPRDLVDFSKTVAERNGVYISLNVSIVLVLKTNCSGNIVSCCASEDAEAYVPVMALSLCPLSKK